MRALVFALSLSGCIFSGPDGAEQSWPPPLGGTVEAVVAGDLDTDGATDVVVFTSGSASNAGAYLLKGTTDIAWGTNSVVRSFSTFVPLPLVSPTAAFLDASAAPRVYVATGKTNLETFALSNTLRELDHGTTTVPGGTTAALGLIDFPGAMTHLWTTDGASIDHAPLTDLSDVKPVPAAMMQSWNGAQAVTSYVDGDSTVVVVAASDNVYRAVIPMTPGSPFSFEKVRTDGAPWLGQTFVDTNGDGDLEVVGFDLQAHQLCLVDVTATVPATPACVTLPMPFPGDEVSIVTGVNLSAGGVPDMLVVQAGDAATNYTVVEDASLTGGTFGHGNLMMIPKTGAAHGKTVVATSGAGQGLSVLTFGSDGSVVCALGPC